MSKRQPWKNINLSSSQAWFIESFFHIFFKILFANGVITVLIHSVCSFAQSSTHSSRRSLLSFSWNSRQASTDAQRCTETDRHSKALVSNFCLTDLLLTQIPGELSAGSRLCAKPSLTASCTRTIPELSGRRFFKCHSLRVRWGLSWLP